ncbi:alpha/beta hydrolase [Timonella sp. A28]|uniref:alpha/beta hydrolase n=1 Tax=Timonella sp. A28 TaxID=3442640 RepID=UPI003EC0D39E
MSSETTEATPLRTRIQTLSSTPLMQKSRSRFLAYCKKFSPVGLVFALVFLCVSLAPSLVPRTWVFQGVLSGLCIAGGYAIGGAVGAFTRWLGFAPWWTPKATKVLWIIFAALTAIFVPLFIILGARWQTELRVLFGMPKNAPSHILTQLLITVGIGLALLVVGRFLRSIGKWCSSKLSRWIPRRAAVLASVIIVAWATAMLIDGTLIRGSLNLLNNAYATSDKKYPDNIDQPLNAERSGSPSSLSDWHTLGYQGRAFVGDGPTQQELQTFADATPALQGTTTKAPIRVYAGLEGAENLNTAAQTVVAELDRTGAWDRKVLMVTTATGTGWIDPAMSSTLELLHGGDTAIASMQYSFLPSWVSFITDRDTPPQAGKILFEAVYEAWLKQPEDTRPKLYVYGLSLGSYGMQGAFSGLQDITERTDGALFVGTPNFTPMWRQFTAMRDPGSPQIAPVINEGHQVRFSEEPNTSEKLWDLGPQWRSPRVVYLQHGSDAVTWWSPELLWDSPDWLNEPAGPDRRVNMVWTPVVTFWQVTFDMFVAGSVPPGHGHMYQKEYADALGAMTEVEGWSPSDYDLLRQQVSRFESPSSS